MVTKIQPRAASSGLFGYPGKWKSTNFLTKKNPMASKSWKGNKAMIQLMRGKTKKKSSLKTLKLETKELRKQAKLRKTLSGKPVLGGTESLQRKYPSLQRGIVAGPQTSQYQENLQRYEEARRQPPRSL